MDDRLSNLPDDIILKILSFVGLKDAIRTSVLSSTWRHVWTSISHINISSEDFCNMDKFSDSVTHVLSRHNNQAKLSSVNLRICGEDGHDVAQRIMNHVFSLNVRQVKIACLFGERSIFAKENLEFPLSLSGSQTLNRLTLRQFSRSYNEIVLTSAQESFPSLTTLHLRFITLYDGLLSAFPNLKNLTLHCCRVTGSAVRCKVTGYAVLRICHPRLSNLTLEKGNIWTRTITVDTPQLKNLTILKYFGGYQVSAPELVSLLIRGPCPSMFSVTNGFHYLKKAILAFHSLGDRSNPQSPYASTIISLLQQFGNVKHLSLSMEIIQLLNSFAEIISHQPSPLAKLKSLMILPKTYCWLKHEHTRVVVSTVLKSHLLSSSPKATLTEVVLEECCEEAARENARLNSLANT